MLQGFCRGLESFGIVGSSTVPETGGQKGCAANCAVGVPINSGQTRIDTVCERSKRLTSQAANMSISVNVHLLSGKSASLEVEADASVESLQQRAQRALAAGGGMLLNSFGEVLDGAKTIKEAKLKSGDELSLHVKQVHIKATKHDGMYFAFAALLGDGSVVTWGIAGNGGDSSAVQEQLKNVQQIQASSGAFAAILGDGSVVTWGHADYGGDSSAVQDQLRNV